MAGGSTLGRARDASWASSTSRRTASPTAGDTPTVDAAVAAALAMVAEGADIIDIGGESTRPGATPVDADRGAAPRPAGDRGAGRPVRACLISIDTYRSETARLAVAAGAHIVNDVFGAQKDPEIARVAAETGSRALPHAHGPRAGAAAGRDRGPVPVPAALAGDRGRARASRASRSSSTPASASPRTGRRTCA